MASRTFRSQSRRRRSKAELRVQSLPHKWEGKSRGPHAHCPATQTKIEGEIDEETHCVRFRPVAPVERGHRCRSRQDRLPVDLLRTRRPARPGAARRLQSGAGGKRQDHRRPSGRDHSGRRSGQAGCRPPGGGQDDRARQGADHDRHQFLERHARRRQARARRRRLHRLIQRRPLAIRGRAVPPAFLRRLLPE